MRVTRPEQTGQHVARPCRRQPRRRSRRDDHLPFRRRDHGVRSLVDDGGSACLGSGHGAVDLVAALRAEQPIELARMGSEEHLAAVGGQAPCALARQQGQGVGIDHQVALRRQHAVQQRLGPLVAAEPRPDDSRADPLVVHQRGESGRVGQRPSDQRIRRVAARRSFGKKDVAGSAVHRGGRGQHRCAGHGAADDGHHAATELLCTGIDPFEFGGADRCRVAADRNADVGE